MSLWLSISARLFVVLATSSLPVVGASRQVGLCTAISPTAVRSSGQVCGRTRESSSQCWLAQSVANSPARCPQASTGILTPASLDEQPESEREVPLGWLVSDDAIHPPSRRALHALGDRPITALERRVERCRLTL